MTTDHILRLLDPSGWARAALAANGTPEGLRQIAKHVTAPQEDQDADEADMAYHHLKISGRLYQQEVDRAHAAEVQAGLH